MTDESDVVAPLQAAEAATDGRHPAERLTLDDRHVSWLAEANGCVAQLVVTDLDLVLFGRPFANSHVMGVELVDAKGNSYQKAYRCA